MLSEKYDSRKVFMMSVPIFIELLLQMLVGNVDQIMLSQFSQNSVAAIGNGNQIMNLIIIVLNMTSVGITIMISQYIGAKDEHKVSEVCNVSLAVMGFFSAALTVVLFLFYKPVFQLLSIPEEIFNEAASYLLIVGSFILVQGLYLTFSAILRSYALMKQVMTISVIMNLLNIIGNALLINGYFFFPRLGIVGAAISTNFSKLIGLALVFMLFRFRGYAELKLSYLKPFPVETCKKLLYISLPSGAEALSYNLSQTIIMKFINMMGTAVIATKVYCSMMANVAYIYSMAIAQATQIIIGYLVGAGRLNEVGRKVWNCVFISIAVSVGLTGVIYFNSDLIFGIFTNDPQILALAKQIVFVEFALEVGRSVNIAMTRALVATYDVKVPVIAGVLSAWGIAVGVGYLLGVQWGWGLIGIWIAMAADELIRAGVFILRFISGVWKQKVSRALPQIAESK